MRFLILSLSLVLAACSPEKPWVMENTNLVTGKMRIVESRHIVKKPLADMSDADIADAARIYNRQGAGPLYLAVAYDDLSNKGINPDVAAKAQALATGLVHHGVTSKIIVSTVQLDAPIPVAVIAFDVLKGAAPAECEGRPSYEEAMLANDGGAQSYDYKLGCGVKEMMAQQIADPRHMEGRAGLGGNTDAERLTNIINNDYRTGETREYLPSYIISELAGQGG